ncbi:hypothetical protein J6590_007242 [Homalodisca vitripennis]|nr:hypothetical protein J6590_007242 [Homalodisca vitripennis]
MAGFSESLKLQTSSQCAPKLCKLRSKQCAALRSGQASLTGLTYTRLYELLPREIPNIQHKGVPLPLLNYEVKNRRGGTTVVQNGVPSLFEKGRSNTKRGTIIIVKEYLRKQGKGTSGSIGVSDGQSTDDG